MAILECECKSVHYKICPPGHLVVSELLSAPSPRAHVSPSLPVELCVVSVVAPVDLYEREKMLTGALARPCYAIHGLFLFIVLKLLEIQFRSLTLDLCWVFLKSSHFHPKPLRQPDFFLLYPPGN